MLKNIPSKQLAMLEGWYLCIFDRGLGDGVGDVAYFPFVEGGGGVVATLDSHADHNASNRPCCLSAVPVIVVVLVCCSPV